MKFKIGDRVKVNERSKCWGGRYAGTVGVVKDIVQSRWPYHVLVGGNIRLYFHANELELVDNQKEVL